MTDKRRNVLVQLIIPDWWVGSTESLLIPEGALTDVWISVGSNGVGGKAIS